MTRKEFLAATTEEQGVFLAKLHHALRNSNAAFVACDAVVEVAEETGMYDNVRFGAEAFQKDIELINSSG